MDNKNANIYRFASIEDAPLLSNLEAMRRSENGDTNIMVEQVKAFWNERLKGPEVTLIAEMPDSKLSIKAIGFLTVNEQKKPVDVFVILDHRSHGVARALLNQAGVCCEPITKEISPFLQEDLRIGATL